jgi:hypothetical protein
MPGNRDLTKNSETGGVQIVTIPNPAADTSPTAQTCVSCMVAQKSGTQAYMNIGAACTTSHWKLSTTPIEVPVTNLENLHFIGTAADLIQILWRS